MIGGLFAKGMVASSFAIPAISIGAISAAIFGVAASGSAVGEVVHQVRKELNEDLKATSFQDRIFTQISQDGKSK